MVVDEDRARVATLLSRLVGGSITTYYSEPNFVAGDGTVVALAMRFHVPDRLPGEPQVVLVAQHQAVPDASITANRVQWFLEHSDSTFTMVDRRGKVIQSSIRRNPLLGYGPEFWREHSVLDLLADEDRERAATFQRDLLKTPGQAGSFEVETNDADGVPQLLQITAVSMLHDPDVEAVLVIARNITAERKVLAELAERHATAEAVAQARSSLLATVSHELRNPLHAVQGTAELLASEVLPARAAVLAASLSRQVAGLATITDDLLQTAQLDAGVVTLHPETFNIRTLIEDTVEFGRVAVNRPELLVSHTIESCVPTWVTADAARLRQVLRNLVGNAVKFTPAGEVRVEVRVPEIGQVEIAVVDTGVGIPEPELRTVLEPFKSASTAGAGRGAGLGLSIVQRLVKAMDGELFLSSDAGRGSRFVVRLPLIATTPPPSAAASAGPVAARVLIVEDNPLNQVLARSQLERLGMVSVIAASGEEAIEVLSNIDPPSVILMDHQLPGMNGVETVHAIRTRYPALADVPVIALTASSTPADRDRFLSAGMDGFVGKPATLADIRSAILAVLDVTADASTSTHDFVPASAFVDETALNQLSDEFSDRTVVADLVEAFLRELPSRAAAITSALEGDDSDALSRAAHTLKSSARLLGAGPLAARCEQLEARESVSVHEFRALIDATGAELDAWRHRS
jgi:PAS domain S-box-containing protein